MSYILAMDAFEALIGGKINLSELAKDQSFATEDQLLMLRSKDARQKSELLARLKSAIPYEVEESDGDEGLCVVRNGPDFETLLGRYEFDAGQPDPSMLVEDVTVVEYGPAPRSPLSSRRIPRFEGS
jgi:hypothetical protein